MLAIISYDISDNRARGRFHKLLKEYGLNTQKSIFECDVDREALREIERRARVLLDRESDSLLVMRICKNCQRQVLVAGQGIKVSSIDYLIC